MSEAATAVAPAAKKSGGKVVLVAAAMASIAAGAAAPMFVNVSALLGKAAATQTDETHEKPAKKKGEHDEEKTASVPFGDVVVNLSEERMTRYLRLKIVLVVDEEAEATFAVLMEKKKATLKSWLISHLSGKTLKDVAGTVGVNRLQREILERFEDTLFPHGHSHLKHVMFEEYLVQ
jgi:flagellar protein FliL